MAGEMTRKLTVALSAAVLTLAGIACGEPEAGGGGGAAPGINALAAAADNARSAGSSAVAMTLTMPVKGKELTADAEGVFDFERQAGEMSMTIEGAGIPSGLTDLEFDMIVDGNDGYMRFPPGLGLGNTWYRISVASRHGVGATGIEQVTQDPTQFLEFLRGASEDEIDDAGTDEIRGVSTTHYEADLSLEKALEQAPNQDAVDEFEAKFGSDLGSLPSVPVDVWIDAEGLPRRIELSVAGMSVSADFFDYGTDVDVEAPKDFEEFPKG